MSRDAIAFTRDKYESLKAAYDEAVAEGKNEFTWNEMSGPGRFARVVKAHRFVTRYARYVLDYLTTEMAKHPDHPARPNNEGEEGQ